MLGDDRIGKDHDGDMKYVLLHIGETMEPDEVKVPKAPHELVDPSPNTENGEPTFEKWTTQENVVASPTTLYLHLYHKETNTRLSFSHMDTSQFRQIKTTLQYIHMEGVIFSTKGGRRGKTRMG